MSLPVRRAIYGKLAGDVTLTALLGTPPAGYAKSIYYQLAPQDSGFPFVLLNKQSGLPRYAFELNDNTLEDEVWLIKAIDRSASADRADEIAARLDSLLTDGALSISGATQLYLRREGSVDYAEEEDGVRYLHSGHLFRLLYEG